jgi:hypothetical protein
MKKALEVSRVPGHPLLRQANAEYAKLRYLVLLVIRTPGWIATGFGRTAPRITDPFLFIFLGEEAIRGAGSARREDPAQGEAVEKCMCWHG